MGIQRTIGLDFGTHQTKLCVQEITEDGVTSYDFMSFKDAKGKEYFTIPSMAWLNEDNTITYGYRKDSEYIEYFQYFKQAVFTKNITWLHSVSPIYLSIWFIANLLFDAEELYGDEFGIQMGIPTDKDYMEERKHDAVVILLSAFHLVETVFQHDKQAFLATKFEELVGLTKILPYDEDQKFAYSIVIIPESLACLMPITANRKLEYGMNLMVDIGGGTTDISFFTVNCISGQPIIYRFTSIPYGLNYLTRADKVEKELDLKSHKIYPNRLEKFHELVNQCCAELKAVLLREFSKTGYERERLLDKLINRPILYTGGGSVFDSLREGYSGFTDIKHVSIKEWHTEEINNLKRIDKLCPVLSTCYGLSSAMLDDVDIPIASIETLFSHMRHDTVEASTTRKKGSQSSVAEELEMGGVGLKRRTSTIDCSTGVIPVGASYELKHGYALAQQYAQIDRLLPLDSTEKIITLLHRLGNLKNTSSAVKLYLSHVIRPNALKEAYNKSRNYKYQDELSNKNDGKLLQDATEEQLELVMKIREVYNGPIPFISKEQIREFFLKAEKARQKYSAKMIARNIEFLCGSRDARAYFDNLLVPPPPPKPKLPPQKTSKKGKKNKKNKKNKQHL